NDSLKPAISQFTQPPTHYYVGPQDSAGSGLDTFSESATFDVSCLEPHMERSPPGSPAAPGITNSKTGECNATCALGTADSRTNNGASASYVGRMQAA